MEASYFHEVEYSFSYFVFAIGECCFQFSTYKLEIDPATPTLKLTILINITNIYQK